MKDANNNQDVTMEISTDIAGDTNTNVTMKTRIYNWINYMCTHHNVSYVKEIPVMFTREYVSSKFGISVRQVMRHLKSLEDEKLIYRYKIYNNITIYSLKPLDISQDQLVRVRV